VGYELLARFVSTKDTSSCRGKATSKSTLVHTLSNIKECIQYENKIDKKIKTGINKLLFYHGARALGKANVASPLPHCVMWCKTKFFYKVCGYSRK
jgi:hypothetical protein